MANRENREAQGEWVEVRRRKFNGDRSKANSSVTTFFVSGFPDGVGLKEIKAPLQRFGEIADVFRDSTEGRPKDRTKKVYGNRYETMGSNVRQVPPPPPQFNPGLRRSFVEVVANDMHGDVQDDLVPPVINDNHDKHGGDQKLVPSGCFGPFPSKLGQSNFSSPEASRGRSNVQLSGSGIKRKRSEFTADDFPLFPRIDELCNTEDEKDTISGEGLVDKNCLESKNRNSSGKNLKSINELEATIKVGTEIGFQVEDGIETFREIMGANGEQLCL
ncbi:hypothetical protein L2E82_08765 [Cichorium intybus]|uniref:Uncharacterized protein n=1 Tax=Cichorium intybus TaxID=13427 RepID=A0ACB9G6V1_CICIN|nr:hypothetical protein L2E82_08765 [Cichorium intybus]